MGARVSRPLGHAGTQGPSQGATGRVPVLPCTRGVGGRSSPLPGPSYPSSFPLKPAHPLGAGAPNPTPLQGADRSPADLRQLASVRGQGHGARLPALQNGHHVALANVGAAGGFCPPLLRDTEQLTLRRAPSPPGLLALRQRPKGSQPRNTRQEEIRGRPAAVGCRKRAGAPLAELLVRPARKSCRRLAWREGQGVLGERPSCFSGAGMRSVWFNIFLFCPDILRSSASRAPSSGVTVPDTRVVLVVCIERAG